MYNEFMNCHSNLYQPFEKENSASISSDGEFDEFKAYEVVDETDDQFIEPRYIELLREKYRD